MEKKRLEIISQMLEFDSSYSIPTAYNGGSPVIDERGKVSFPVFAEKFKEVHLSQKGRGTRKTQSSIIDNHFVPYFKAHELATIQKQQIDEYFASKKLNENVKKFHYSVLHSIFKRTIEWNYLEADPFKLYNKDNKPYKISDEAGTVIIDEEFEKILSKADSHLVPILKCLWMTGMRKAEALTLEWDDIDFKKNHILSRGV